MALKAQILDYINAHPGASDTEMEKAFNVIHQAVNVACRQLEREGRVVRRKIPGRPIGNYPADIAPEALPQADPAPPKADAGAPLEEEDLKRILTERLTADGWTVSTAWGHAPGVDIDARRGKERWLIEIKGPGSRPQMRVNYFLSMLGEILQRMDDPAARYSIALPDMPQYRGLWERLPSLAKKRTGIDILFVDATGRIGM